MLGKYQTFINIIGQDKITIKEPLDKYTSFKIGGPADLFIKAKNSTELIEIIEISTKLKIPFFVLGGGTNILISDSGFCGLVIKNEVNTIKFISLTGAGNKKEGYTLPQSFIREAYLEVDSGVLVNRLVRYSLDEGFEGIEAFLGQPGTVGGAVYINAHNMREGKYFGDNIFSAKLITAEGSVKHVDRDYFNFGYDQSIIQETKEIVASVVIQLRKGHRDKLWKRANEVLEYRRATQPQGYSSAGCIFRNISNSEVKRLSTPENTRSAGYLLDKVGLKGKKIGGAQFSLDHANFIINTGAASAEDVIQLITLAKREVYKKFSVTLEEEVVYLGKITHG